MENLAELKIGVIGGGQLARMMVAPALQLGFDLRVLSETDDSPAIIAATPSSRETNIPPTATPVTQ